MNALKMAICMGAGRMEKSSVSPKQFLSLAALRTINAGTEILFPKIFSYQKLATTMTGFERAIIKQLVV
jgi:hypothetical protein